MRLGAGAGAWHPGTGSGQTVSHKPLVIRSKTSFCIMYAPIVHETCFTIAYRQLAIQVNKVQLEYQMSEAGYSCKSIKFRLSEHNFEASCVERCLPQNTRQSHFGWLHRVQGTNKQCPGHDRQLEQDCRLAPAAERGMRLAETG